MVLRFTKAGKALGKISRNCEPKVTSATRLRSSCVRSSKAANEIRLPWLCAHTTTGRWTPVSVRMLRCQRMRSRKSTTVR